MGLKKRSPSSCARVAGRSLLFVGVIVAALVGLDSAVAGGSGNTSGSGAAPVTAVTAHAPRIVGASAGHRPTTSVSLASLNPGTGVNVDAIDESSPFDVRSLGSRRPELHSSKPQASETRSAVLRAKAALSLADRGVVIAAAPPTNAAVENQVVTRSGDRSVEVSPAGELPSAIVYHVNHASPAEQFLALRSLQNHIFTLNDDDTAFLLVLQGGGLRLLHDAVHDPDRSGMIDVLLLHGVRLITDQRSLEKLGAGDLVEREAFSSQSHRPGVSRVSNDSPAKALTHHRAPEEDAGLYAAQHLEIVPSVLFFLSDAQRRGARYIKP